MNKKDFLLRMRKDLGLSRKVMSELTDTPSRTIGAYERGELTIQTFAGYIPQFCAVAGISEDIFDFANIEEENIENNKLTQFSQGLRKYVIWANLSPSDIVPINEDSLIMDKYHWLTNATINKQGIHFYIAKEHIHYLVDNWAKKYAKIEISEESHETFEMADITIRNTEKKYYDMFFLREALKVILRIGKFKPSSFGIKIEDIEKLLIFDSTDEDIHLHKSAKAVEIYDPFEKQIQVAIPELEDNGLELTKGNVQKAFSEGVLLNSAQKQLLDLWQYAPKPVQDKILATLQKYKDQANELDDL